MHIIKITPHSFKIVLSKEDLKTHGVENILESKSFLGDFFAEIIEETNALYGNPFANGSVNAEFFESKDGGGELFISSSCINKEVTYLFMTRDFEILTNLCKRLAVSSTPVDSILFASDNGYSLLLYYTETEDFVFSCLKEYGEVVEANRLKQWMLYEHAKVLIDKKAVEHISDVF